MKRCPVRGCEREGVFTLSRVMPGDNHPRVVLLAYCATHYGQANTFKRDRRRDRRPVQTNA
jgi:hypothetical protein